MSRRKRPTRPLPPPLPRGADRAMSFQPQVSEDIAQSLSADRSPEARGDREDGLYEPGGSSDASDGPDDGDEGSPAPKSHARPPLPPAPGGEKRPREGSIAALEARQAGRPSPVVKVPGEATMARKTEAWQKKEQEWAQKEAEWKKREEEQKRKEEEWKKKQAAPQARPGRRRRRTPKKGPSDETPDDAASPSTPGDEGSPEPDRPRRRRRRRRKKEAPPPAEEEESGEQEPPAGLSKKQLKKWRAALKKKRREEAKRKKREPPKKEPAAAPPKRRRRRRRRKKSIEFQKVTEKEVQEDLQDDPDRVEHLEEIRTFDGGSLREVPDHEKKEPEDVNPKVEPAGAGAPRKKRRRRRRRRKKPSEKAAAAGQQGTMNLQSGRDNPVTVPFEEATPLEKPSAPDPVDEALEYNSATVGGIRKSLTIEREDLLDAIEEGKKLTPVPEFKKKKKRQTLSKQHTNILAWLSNKKKKKPEAGKQQVGGASKKPPPAEDDEDEGGVGKDAEDPPEREPSPEPDPEPEPAKGRGGRRKKKPRGKRGKRRQRTGAGAKPEFGTATEADIRDAVEGDRDRKKHLAEIKKFDKGQTLRNVKRSQKKYSDSSLKRQRGVEEDDIDKLGEDTLDELCRTKAICYLHVNSYSDVGESLFEVLEQTMPLRIDDRFCLIGYLRKKGSLYQFIIHDKTLLQTYEYDRVRERFRRVKRRDDCGTIKRQHRGYNLPSKEIAAAVVAKKPRKGFPAINKPYEEKGGGGGKKGGKKGGRRGDRGRRGGRRGGGGRRAGGRRGGGRRSDSDDDGDRRGGGRRGGGRRAGRGRRDRSDSDDDYDRDRGGRRGGGRRDRDRDRDRGGGGRRDRRRDRSDSDDDYDRDRGRRRGGGRRDRDRDRRPPPRRRDRDPPPRRRRRRDDSDSDDY